MNIGFFLAKGAATSLGAPVAGQLRGGGSTQPGGRGARSRPHPRDPRATGPLANVHSFATFQSFFPPLSFPPFPPVPTLDFKIKNKK